MFTSYHVLLTSYHILLTSYHFWLTSCHNLLASTDINPFGTYINPVVSYTKHQNNVITFLSAINWSSGVFIQVLLTSRQGRIDWERPHKRLYLAISYTYSANPGFSEMASRDKSSFLNQLSRLGWPTISPEFTESVLWLSWARAAGL